MASPRPTSTRPSTRVCPIIEWSCHRKGIAKQPPQESTWREPCRAKTRIRILCSPYVRTRQTSAAIEKALTAAGMPFDRREAVELREISFGLFDGIADEDLPKSFPQEYEHYEKHKQFEGEFFAPMPLGESRVHVADRVKGVFGTILRDAIPRAEQSGRQLYRRKPRRDDPLLPDAMDALSLGMVRAARKTRIIVRFN